MLGLHLITLLGEVKVCPIQISMGVFHVYDES